MAILVQHYHNNRHRIELLLNFAEISNSYNILLCYANINEQHENPTLAIGELLLTLTCPDVIKHIPKERRFNEISFAISASAQLKKDIHQFKQTVHKAIREVM